MPSEVARHWDTYTAVGFGAESDKQYSSIRESRLIALHNITPRTGSCSSVTRLNCISTWCRAPILHILPTSTCFLLPSNTRIPKAPLQRTISLLALTPMSHTHPTASSFSSSSNFQLMINNALDEYKKCTKNDLLAHPLAARLQTCKSPGAIIAILQEQVQGLHQSRSSDERWSKWLGPTVNVLQAFSSILEAGATLVCFRSCIYSNSTVSCYLTGIPTCE